MSINENTIKEYLEGLRNLMILEELPAYDMHIRSNARLIKAKKKYFVCPSIATSILEIDDKKILTDMNYFGELFENLVLRDIFIYTQTLNVNCFHYRDSNGLEADLIIENRSGDLFVFEIKLGFGQVELAANNLLNIKKILDTGNKNISLNIITGTGFSHTRKDGINVIPITCLKD